MFNSLFSFPFYAFVSNLSLYWLCNPLVSLMHLYCTEISEFHHCNSLSFFALWLELYGLLAIVWVGGIEILKIDPEQELRSNYIYVWSMEYWYPFLSCFHFTICWQRPNLFEAHASLLVLWEGKGTETHFDVLTYTKSAPCLLTCYYYINVLLLILVTAQPPMLTFVLNFALTSEDLVQIKPLAQKLWQELITN